MLPQNNLIKILKWIPIVAVIVCLVFIYFREGRIAELELQNNVYRIETIKLQTERKGMIEDDKQLQTTLTVKQDSIKILVEQLTNLPKDEDIPKPTLITPDDGWDAVLRANEIPDSNPLSEY